MYEKVNLIPINLFHKTCILLHLHILVHYSNMIFFKIHVYMIFFQASEWDMMNNNIRIYLLISGDSLHLRKILLIFRENKIKLYIYTYCKIFDFLNRQSYSIFSPDTSFVHWNNCSIFDDFWKRCFQVFPDFCNTYFSSINKILFKKMIHTLYDKLEHTDVSLNNWFKIVQQWD